MTGRAAAGMAALLLGLAGCTAPGAGAPAEARDESPVDPARYLGVETRKMDPELVNLVVSMRGPRDNAALTAYARCAAAQYALIRDHGFARHLRTTVYREGGTWRADAVYTISRALPDGLAIIDAEIEVADCAARGIPTV